MTACLQTHTPHKTYAHVEIINGFQFAEIKHASLLDGLKRVELNCGSNDDQNTWDIFCLTHSLMLLLIIQIRVI